MLWVAHCKHASTGAALCVEVRAITCALQTPVAVPIAHDVSGVEPRVSSCHR